MLRSANRPPLRSVHFVRPGALLVLALLGCARPAAEDSPAVERGPAGSLADGAARGGPAGAADVAMPPATPSAGANSAVTDGSGVAQPAVPAGASARPNVVIYLVDTLRPDRCSLYGYSKGTTPALEELARESVVFEQAYTAAPWTLPAVASLLTSTFPCEHGMNIEVQQPPAGLDPLPVQLKRLGYQTHNVHRNVYVGRLCGLERGYDVLHPGQTLEIDEDVQAWRRTDVRLPYFLYIHSIEPHNPYAVPPRFVPQFGTTTLAFRERYRERMISYRGLTIADWKNRRPIGTTDNTVQQQELLGKLIAAREKFGVLYDASVRWADENLAAVLAQLRERGEWDNTLLVFLSDHGEEFGEHGGWLHDQSVYEELIRVPLLIRLPRGEFGGRRVREVVSLVDIVPTLLDYLQQPRPSGLTGQSLMPRIRGEPGRSADAIIPLAVRVNLKKYFRPWKESRGDVNVAVRQGDWKAILNVETGSLELYDLRTDPGEQQDRAAQEPARAATLRAFAQRWFEECRRGSVPTSELRPEQMDDESLRQLRALGYID